MNEAFYIPWSFVPSLQNLYISLAGDIWRAEKPGTWGGGLALNELPSPLHLFNKETLCHYLKFQKQSKLIAVRASKRKVRG